MLPARDPELVQIVDAALADATRRAQRPASEPWVGASPGSWLACRPGCTPCCHGVFRVSQLDAERLRDGLRALAQEQPRRAEAIRNRAAALVQELRPFFPGDAQTGALAPAEGRAEEDRGWDKFADLEQADAPCPVLDPATGRCELYASRPLTCRIFGPPVRNDAGIGVCELCYVGASEADILAGEMHLQHQALEAELDRELPPGETIIAWAVLPERS